MTDTTEDHPAQAPQQASSQPRLTLRKIMVIVAIVAGASGAGGSAISFGLDQDDLRQHTVDERERSEERYAPTAETIRMGAKLDAIGTSLVELKGEVQGLRRDIRDIERGPR